jgi:hypothetical protein
LHDDLMRQRRLRLPVRLYRGSFERGIDAQSQHYDGAGQRKSGQTKQADLKVARLPWLLHSLRGTQESR